MIEFKMEKNKEENSLCKIVKNNKEIALTETELEALIFDIYKLRPDAFNTLPFNNEIKRLKREIEYLQEED